MNTNDQKLKIWIGIGIGILAVIVIVAIYITSRHTPTYNNTTVARRNITQTIRSTGTVSAEQSSSLSFSTQGKIQEILVHAGDVVHKGDILASLDAGTIRAQLNGAFADLAASESQLVKLESGARPEELALYSQKYADASSALLLAMNNAYFQVTDALNNKSDLLFTNGNSVNPVITIRTDSQTQQTNINTERVALRDTLNKWKEALINAQLSTSTLSVARQITRNALADTQLFLGNLSSITSALSPGNSGLSQTAINADLALVNGASQQVTAGANAFTTADAAWSSARDSLALENAGTRTEDIASQSAVMEKAQAQVEAYQSALSQSYIRAPFDGTITEVNMDVGEVVVPGISAGKDIGIINTNLFNIETYIPENAIGAMTVGNPAIITSDAYGSATIFPAHVYMISPAETTIKGINSYKVILRFDQSDSRIRSGLTVNTVITAATATDALAVPSRAIITKNEQKYVLLKDISGAYVQHLVTTGITGSDGYTEILSGLNEGDVVASFGIQN